MVKILGSLVLGISLAFTLASASSNGTSGLPVGPVAMTGGSGYTPPEIDDIIWNTGTSNPITARHSAVSGWWNGQVFFANGAIPGFWGTDLCQSYDPILDVWTTMHPSPTARGNVGGGRVQSQQYLHSVGGIMDTGGGGQVVGTYERYDMDLDTWITMPPCTPRWGHGAAALEDGTVFVFGGHNASVNTSVEKFDPVSLTWSSNVAQLPVPRVNCAGAAAFGKVYCIGGSGANTMYEYDPVADTWTLRAPIPTQRAFHAAIAAGSGKIKVFGGNIGGPDPTPDVLAYLPWANVWIPETPMPGARDWPCLGSNGAETFFVMGGSDLGPGVFYDQMWIGEELGFVFIIVAPVDTTGPGGGPVVPATGGAFSWTGTVTNNETTPQTFDVWTMITLPNGSQWGPPLGPVVLTLAAGSTIQRTRTQIVPGYAPPGSYTYTGYVGDYPNVIWDSDSFPFTKSAADDGGAWVGDWSDFGQSFEDESAGAVMPEEFSITNYPNPFNPITTIAYSLGHSEIVNLTVFDLSGRAVAKLVNGWRAAGSHSVSFDASDLPSGVYIYRLTAGASTATAKMVLMK